MDVRHPGANTSIGIPPSVADRWVGGRAAAETPVAKPEVTEYPWRAQTAQPPPAPASIQGHASFVPPLPPPPVATLVIVPPHYH